MKHSFRSSILAGIAATFVMTLVTMAAPMMGFPPMNPAAMLSETMHAPIIAGWLAHFMIGILFAVSYTLFIADRLKVSPVIIKGSLFGFGVFLFAQIMMAMMNAVMGGMPSPEGSMALLLVGSIMGHVIYGIVVALIAKPSQK